MRDTGNHYHRAIRLPVEPSESCWQSMAERWSKPASRGIIPFEPEPHIRHWLHGLGVETVFSEAFYTPPGMRLGIHRDGRDPPGVRDRTKINWIRGADTSRMIWYETIAEAYEGDDHVTSGGTVSRTFSPYMVRQVFDVIPHSPCLLNVGRPHTVHNHTQDGRWCLSYTLGVKDTRRTLQWPEAIEIFAPWMVDTTEQQA